MNKTKPLIVFDLDGTLIDTAPDLLASLDTIITADGLDPIDRKAMRSHVGFGARVMLRNAYQSAGKHLSSEKLDRLVADFIAHYAGNMPGTSQPFEGLLSAMTVLGEKGCRFAVCTNKTEILANQLLEALGMSHWFAAVTGQDTFSVRKPHPDHLLKTIAMAGADNAEAIMVGDTPTDFSTAKAAMIPCIAVEFGYCDSPLAQYEVSKIISHFDEMTPELIGNILGNR